ncbi:MAG: hypothetical protein WCR06_08085 [bacterium]
MRCPPAEPFGHELRAEWRPGYLAGGFWSGGNAWAAVVGGKSLPPPLEHSRGTCSGHPALTRAIATLLCQRAQLNQRAASTVAAAKAGGVVGALLIGAIEEYLQGTTKGCKRDDYFR